MSSELQVNTITEATSGSGITFAKDIIPATPLSHRNMVINGDFRVNQEGNKLTKTGPEKRMAGDRWHINMSGFGTWSGGTEADAPTGSGFRKSSYLNCTSAQASPGAAAYCVFGQRLEGQDLQLIRKGTSSAKPVTLSFWVKSPKTGTHICELYDGDNNRHCSQSYTIGTANTWEYKSVTFPGDTTGAFDDDNALSLYVQWWLGAGSNYTTGTLQTTWGNTQANRVVGQVNVADAVHSSNNVFQLTGAQLELGSVATPFEHRSFADELNRCQRYYEKSYNYATLPGTASVYPGLSLSGGAAGNDTTQFISGDIRFKVRKRATPTIVFFDYAGNINKGSTFTRGISGPNNDQSVSTANIGETSVGYDRSSGTSNSNVAVHYTADAEFA